MGLSLTAEFVNARRDCGQCNTKVLFNWQPLPHFILYVCERGESQFTEVGGGELDQHIYSTLWKWGIFLTHTQPKCVQRQFTVLQLECAVHLQFSKLILSSWWQASRCWFSGKRVKWISNPIKFLVFCGGNRSQIFSWGQINVQILNKRLQTCQ